MGWHSITNGLGVPMGGGGGASNTDINRQFAFFSTCPRVNGKLKLLHLFGLNHMTIKMFLISVG